MRLEPRILDRNIEKKSLYEKNTNAQQQIDSFDALFADFDIDKDETLSKLEAIDDEDRNRAFEVRQIGKAFVPGMDTKEVEKAMAEEENEKVPEEWMKLCGIDESEITKRGNELDELLKF